MYIGKVEEVLVKILIQRTKINNLLAYSEGLGLVNSIIKDSSIVINIWEFKKKRGISNRRNVNDDEIVSLDKGYWVAFLRRYHNKIATAQSTRININRVK